MLMAPKFANLVGVISRQRAVKGELHRHGAIKSHIPMPNVHKKSGICSILAI
jgi:hypothetical protein